MGNDAVLIKDKEQILTSLTEEALSSVGYHSYIGKSWRDLTWDGDYVEEGLSLTEEDMELMQLYAGLSVLSLGYYKKTGMNKEDKYNKVIEEVHQQDFKRYSFCAYPYLDVQTVPFTAELEQINMLLDEKFSMEVPSLEILKYELIRHEWTVKPGKRLYNELLSRVGDKLKKFVCDKNDGLLVKLNKGGDEKDIIKESAKCFLLAIGFSNEPILAFSVLFATILVKRGLALYCKGYD